MTTEVLVTVDIYDTRVETDTEGVARVIRKGQKLYSVTLEGASLEEVAKGLDRLIKAANAQDWHIE